MGRLSHAIREYLSAKKLDYSEGESEAEYYEIRGRGNTCFVFCRILVDEKKRQIQISVTGSAKVRFMRIIEVSRLLDWSNRDDILGRFTLNTRTGEVAYSTTLSAAEADLEPALIARVVGIAITRYDRLFPALISVIYSEASAEHIIPITESPKWERIRKSLEELASPIQFEPPGEPPAAIDGMLNVSSLELSWGNTSESGRPATIDERTKP